MLMDQLSSEKLPSCMFTRPLMFQKKQTNARRTIEGGFYVVFFTFDILLYF